MSISKEKYPVIITLYQKEMYSMDEIAKVFNVTRTTIHKILKKLGIPTQKGIATQRSFKCEQCQKEFSIARSRAKKNPSVHKFCSRYCYNEWLRRNDYIQSRNALKSARELMEALYGYIPEGAIIHHIDGNEFNNSVCNILLLRSQEDHIKIHRDIPGVEPLFDGRLLNNNAILRDYRFNEKAAAILKIFNSTAPIPTTPMNLTTTIQFIIQTLKTSTPLGPLRATILSFFEDQFEDVHRLFDLPETYVSKSQRV